MLKIIRLVVFVTIIVSILIFPSSSLQAVDNDFVYWYSDSNEIRYWAISSIPTYFFSSTTVGDKLTVSNLVTYSSTGVVRWGPATNYITYNIIPVASVNPSLRIIPKTIQEAQTAPSVLAVTTIPRNSKQAIGAGYYNNQLKTIYQIVGPIDIWPIYGPATYCYSTADWTIVMVHEWGHALGYAGHYASGGAVMIPTDLYTTYPNINEKNHLFQIYAP